MFFGNNCVALYTFQNALFLSIYLFFSFLVENNQTCDMSSGEEILNTFVKQRKSSLAAE